MQESAGREMHRPFVTVNFVGRVIHALKGGREDLKKKDTFSTILLLETDQFSSNSILF